MTFVHLEDKNWLVKFGDFDEEEAPALADNIVEFSNDQGAHQFIMLDWSPAIESVVNCLYGEGFVFTEEQDDDGKVTRRAVYRKRAAELRF